MNNTTLFVRSIPGAPRGWTEELYLTPSGDYYVATFYGPSIKDDCPIYLAPAGEPVE